EVAVVLDEDGVDVLERAVGVLVERDVWVQRVDAGGRPEAEGPATRRLRSGSDRACREDQGAAGQQERRKPPLPHFALPLSFRTATRPRSTFVRRRRAYTGHRAEWKRCACRGRAAACTARAPRAAAGACRARPRSSSWPTSRRPREGGGRSRISS